MAKIIRRNTLTDNQECIRVSVSNAYSIFLRSQKPLWSAATYKIYVQLGNNIIIPGLTELTGDDMNLLTHDTVRSVLDNYESSHTSGGTNYLYRHLKAFVNWYWAEFDVEADNPIKKIKQKKINTPPKVGITQDEVDAILKTAKARSVFPERDVAFIMLLCDTGIRRSSIEKLRMRDVNTDKSELLIFGKDQKYHVKAYGSATTKAIRKYLLCLTDVKPDDPFWLQMDGRALTRVGMREVLRRLCSEAGIAHHEFHDFRRYYGKTLYESTHDIYLVSRALDHKDIQVTKRYIAIDEEEEKEAARIYSPMDRKFGQTGIKVNR